MATSRSGAELAGKFYRAATILPAANRQAVEQAALFAKEEFIRGAVAAGLRQGGALPKASGARWGARYDVKGTRNPTAMVRYVGPVHWAFSGTKPHTIVASQFGNFRAGTRREYANGRVERVRARNRRAEALEDELGANLAFGGSGRGLFGDALSRTRSADAKRLAKGRRLRARKRALKTPDGLRAYAFHPGHRGRNTWPAVKARIERGTPAVFADANRNALIRSGFGR